MTEEKKINIDYRDAETLKGFISENGKILSSRYTRLNAKEQRKLTKAIKKARLLSVTFVCSVKLSGNMLSLSNSTGSNLLNFFLCSTTCLNLDGVDPPSEVIMVREGELLLSGKIILPSLKVYL